VGQDPQISPDGKRVLVKKAPSDGGNNNIWVEDLEKGTTLRITSTFSQMPIWSPDGNRIAYNCDVGICLKNANGLGEAEQLYAGTNFTMQWSPDGRYIVAIKQNPIGLSSELKKNRLKIEYLAGALIGQPELFSEDLSRSTRAFIDSVEGLARVFPFKHFGGRTVIRAKKSLD
jgi:dipeptidyl aminopeptidase/acylaminoacyl peptidase